MKLNVDYTYREGETPEERLRNKLSPFFSLVAIIKLNYKGAAQSKELKKLLQICEDNKEDIKTLLGDIPNFYK